MADHGQKFEVKVEVPDGHQINNADRHAFLEQGQAPGDEDIAMFRSILVRRTDNLDGRDQVPPVLRMVDPDLV